MAVARDRNEEVPMHRSRHSCTHGILLGAAALLTVLWGSAVAEDSATPIQQPAGDVNGLPAALAWKTAADLDGALVQNRNGAVIGKLSRILRDNDGSLIAIVRPGNLGDASARGAAFPLADFGNIGDRLTAPTDLSPALIGRAENWSAADYQPVPEDVPLYKLAPGGEFYRVADESAPSGVALPATNSPHTPGAGSR
jgi:hypothetical protein